MSNLLLSRPVFIYGAAYDGSARQNALEVEIEFILVKGRNTYWRNRE